MFSTRKLGQVSLHPGIATALQHHFSRSLVSRSFITSPQCVKTILLTRQANQNRSVWGLIPASCKRLFSISSTYHYEVSVVPGESKVTDLKPDAQDIFRTAIRSVYPKSMIGNVLLYNAVTSTLKVQGKTYKLDRNVFVVGMGKAVAGMAGVVEDILGAHIVTGVISIPEGLQEQIQDENPCGFPLRNTTKIQIYEGSSRTEADEASYNAAKAIHNLVSKLTEKDLLIVLCSGGGSVLCPLPHSPITLDELRQVTRLLKQNGANVKEVNTVRKNIEVLKGGGLAMEAKPAKVVSLILSSFIGDPIDLIASGPTCPSQPAPHHCIEIMNRLGIMDQVPESVRKFLERETVILSQKQKILDSIQAKAELDATWADIQNIVVGNNSIACEAAATRASELGYLPLILTTKLVGEARNIGTLLAKLAKFIMMCYDRKTSMEPNMELTILEVELVAGGIRKEWINHICNSLDRAHNMNKDLCIICGGEIMVQVKGSGIGGKNMEAALAAAIHMKKLFRLEEMPVAETRMCFLCCDSDGLDGVTKMAGAIVDQDFLNKVEERGLEMGDYLENNDSFSLFSQVDNGQYLVKTNVTGTNIMDLVVMLVQKPQDRKYAWI
ncbi:glycerate kinase [Plakobranchus ocellatus]|uniref:Glycerate kinase n=1 Tax=Plakobranchus ocellatus TaxID=259542 RepID=A0AAV4DM12_9GAST|nr:glycerate kinase [Plakobranchus ocellatus]